MPVKALSAERRSIMDQNLLEITQHDGAGFKPLVIREGWRAAILNDDPAKYRLENLCDFERHNKTDEVFVLLEGRCTLLIGDGKGEDVGTIRRVEMEKKKFYNVRQGVWHNLLGEAGMALMVVENADTSRQNSDFVSVPVHRIPKGDETYA